ncbi:alpha/beta-hydrolase [Periconia macrospinosa]|uniref:Alpha/beta-hydrolase n=1 Tax=Periconia macrospinosa TaxID=97972 RepID=A0A2V1DDD0_9PLEO|nr:alpha/beta-hydrolase [Periconia macrospinosa]
MFPIFNLKSYFDWIVYGPQALPHPAGPPPYSQDSPFESSEFTPYTENSNIVTLSDGRKIGYAQYGTPTGKPVIFLHGMPGSRLDAGHFDDLGKELGARVIGIDRPGIGWSTPHPSRTLLDHAKDVEAVADHLQLNNFRIMGVSAGGPYALACAKALPREKLLAVSIMCGFCPLEIDTSLKGTAVRMGLGLMYPFLPNVVRLLFQNSPIGRLDLTDETRLDMLLKQVAASKPKNAAGKVERDATKQDPGGVLRALRSCREAFSQDSNAPGFDGRLIGQRYYFKIEDIRKDLPFQLWYGTLDGTTPINHGRLIAERLGERAQYRESEDTHGSLQVRFKREAWEALLRSG